MLPFTHCAVLYVSNAPDASDEASGTAPVRTSDGRAPLRTISAALARAAELRRAGVRQPLTIRLAPGTYELSAPLRLSEEHSGVTLDGGGAAILSGGRALTGWQPDTFNGVPCLSAPVPDGMRFTDLYANGERAALTRYPAEGFLTPESVENPSTALYAGSSWFIARKGDIRDFYSFEDCLISYRHFWIDEHSPVASYDPATRRVTMAYRSRFSIAGGPDTPSGLAYVIENTAEAFSRKNDWYFDRAAGRVYYIPRDASVTAETIDAHAPVTDALLTVEGNAAPADGIRIRGITFAWTKSDYASLGGTTGGGDSVPHAADPQSVCNAGGVVTFRNARACSLEDCTLASVGHHAVFIGEAAHAIRVEDCVVRDGGMGAVRICGAPADGDPALASSGHTVTRCRFTGLGRRFSSACGVLIMHASECEVSHCEIADLYYTGVSVGWVWGYAENAAHHNRILKNHIHDLGHGLLSDMGGVYLLGRQPGTVVAGNVIHDVRSAHYGGWALYTDEGSSYITLEGNLCYNVSENCFHQHYGEQNTVRGNIFAFPGQAAVRFTRPETHLSVVFENNLILCGGKPAWAMREAQLASGTVAAHGCRYVGVGEKHVSFGGFSLSFDEARVRGFDSDAELLDDPFADAAHYDFRLKKSVPGFAEIPLPRTGPHCDR